MTIKRTPNWPNPMAVENLEDVLEYLRKLYRAQTDEGAARIKDFAKYSESTHAHDSSYISIVGTPTAGNFPTLTAGGELANST